LTRAKAALSAAAKLAAGYTLLLKGSDGAYTPVPSGTTFHAGDSVRLQVAPSEAGYIYLFQRDATTGWRLVESQIVDKVQRYMVPSTGGLRSDKPTQVELLLVFSRVEQPAFAGAPTSDVDALASKEQTSFRITLEYR